MRVEVTELRLRILQVLSRRPPGFSDCGWTGGMLIREIGVPETTLRRHVRVLRDAGLVINSMTGYRLHPVAAQHLDAMATAAVDGSPWMLPLG
jgi:DNA-binding IclR family transcriptional regulator